jgi:thiol-disulfide isomerase/thioredoxin
MKLLAILLFLLASPLLLANTDFKIDDNTDLSDLKGQVVYVDFWASWCKPCKASFPWMNEMQAKYKDQGLRVVAINLDEDKSDALVFLKRVPAEFTMVFDPTGAIANQYQLVGMPSSYIIDRSGNLRFAHQGFFVAKQNFYEDEIIQLLNE